jgi:hypothetical protein
MSRADPYPSLLNGNCCGGKSMNKFSIVIFVVIILYLPACLCAIGADGPYEGRVIDGDTGKPIERVVILVAWYTSQFSPAGSTHNFYNAKETVTDNKGEFSIPGMGLKALTNLESMHVLIFKAGYEYLNVPWVSLKKDILLKEKIKWEGNRAIIPLKRLSMEERKKQGTPSFPSEAYKNKRMPLLISEINKEEVDFGRKPYPEE